MGDTMYKDFVVTDGSGNEKVLDVGTGSNYSGALNMLGSQYAPHIEKVRQSAYRAANDAYKKSINNANSSYQRSLSNYGANAERLASRGLGMSGVSDYGNSAAYYALRNEVQNAGTQLTSAKQAADDAAYERQTAYNSQQSDRYMNVLAGVLDGTYSSDMVEGFIKEYGFDGTQKATLEKKVIFRDASDGLVSNTFSSAAEVEAYVKQYENKIDKDDYTKLQSEAASVIKINRFNTADLEDGNIKSEAEKNQIRTISAIYYDNLKDGEDIEVNLNGTKYLVESDGLAKGEVVRYAKNNNMQDGEIFLHGESEDVYIYDNGNVYRVVSKDGKKEEFNSQYNDVRHYLQYNRYGSNYEDWKNKKNNNEKSNYSANYEKSKKGRSQGLG